LSTKTKKVFYFYKVKLEEDEGYLLGCAGPYSLDPNKVNSFGITAKINYGESFSDGHIEEQINKLIRIFVKAD